MGTGPAGHKGHTTAPRAGFPRTRRRLWGTPAPRARRLKPAARWPRPDSCRAAACGCRVTRRHGSHCLLSSSSWTFPETLHPHVARYHLSPCLNCVDTPPRHSRCVLALGPAPAHHRGPCDPLPGPAPHGLSGEPGPHSRASRAWHGAGTARSRPVRVGETRRRAHTSSPTPLPLPWPLPRPRGRVPTLRPPTRQAPPDPYGPVGSVIADCGSFAWCRCAR